MSNITKKSILLTVSSFVISQFILHANYFDELEFDRSQTPNFVQATPRQVSSNLLGFDHFGAAIPQQTKINSNLLGFDHFGAAIPQQTKVNSGLLGFDHFGAAIPQQTKVNSGLLGFGHFEVATSQQSTSSSPNLLSSNSNIDLINEIANLKAKNTTLETQINNLLTQVNSRNDDILNNILTQLRLGNNNDILNNILTQLQSGNSGHSRQSNPNNNEVNNTASAEIAGRIETFRNTFTSGVIALTSEGSERAPIVQLMEDIKQANDRQSAENIVGYLMEELNSADPERAESITAILSSNATPKIIRDAQEAISRKQTQDTLRSIYDESAPIEALEAAGMTNIVSSTPITQINPVSLLLLFPTNKFSRIPMPLAREFQTYFKSTPLTQRKIILKKLSTLIGNQINAINAPQPNMPLENIFSSLYGSFIETERNFVAPSSQAARRTLKSLNEQILNLTGDGEGRGNVVVHVPDPTLATGTVTPPPPPPPPSTTTTGPSAPPPSTTTTTGPSAPPPPPPPPPPSTTTTGPSAPPTPTPSIPSMAPVIPTDGAGAGRVLTSSPSMVEGLELRNDLITLGYTAPRTRVIVAYMTAHPGTTRRTAVNTLILNNHPLFTGTTIISGT